MTVETKKFSDIAIGSQFIEVLSTVNELAVKLAGNSARRVDSGKVIFMTSWKPVFVGSEINLVEFRNYLDKR